MQNERFHRQEGSEHRTVQQTEQRGGQGKVTFPQGKAGIWQADHLTCAIRLVLSDWFKIPFLRELKMSLN